MRILKTEVEQGFMRTVFGHELVGPKRQSNFVTNEGLKKFFAFDYRKGKRLKFLYNTGKLRVETRVRLEKSVNTQKGVLSSF